MVLSNQLPSWFVTEYDDEVRHKFQQLSSKLRERVFNQTVKGTTAKFPLLGKGTVTKNKPANDDQEAESGGHTQPNATLDDYTTGRYVGKLDAEKFNDDLMAAYTTNQSATMGRELDFIILTAVDGSTTSGNGNINADSGGLTYEKLLAGQKLFRKNGMSSDPMMSTLVVDEEGWEDLATETEFTNTDFVTYRVAESGTVPVVLGQQVVSVVPEVVPNRVVSATSSYAFSIHREAVGLAVNSEVNTDVDYIPEKFSHFVGTSFSAVGVTIDSNGVYRYDVGQS